MIDEASLRYIPFDCSDLLNSEPEFRKLLDRVVAPPKRASLLKSISEFSRNISEVGDRLSKQAANGNEIPRIENGEKIWLPEPTRYLRRKVVEAGLIDNETQIEFLAKVYLLGHFGEGSLICAISCTEGLIRVLTAVGDDTLKQNFLSKLKSTDIPLSGAQFITEREAGSGIGAIKTEAKPNPDGSWNLFGEKAFCSNSEEFFVIAARPKGAPSGTSGIGIFLVPRVWNGSTNSLKFKNLRQKLGTRELSTVDIELHGTRAFGRDSE